MNKIIGNLSTTFRKNFQSHMSYKRRHALFSYPHIKAYKYFEVLPIKLHVLEI